LILIPVLHLNACNITTKENKETNQPIDTTKSFKVDKYLVSPDPAFEYIALVKSSGDTLEFKACSEFLCSPFGTIKNQSELKTSLLKIFNVIRGETDSTIVLGESNKLELKYKSNKLNLVFSQYTDSSRYSYIDNGEINYKEVIFNNNIRIGMSKEDFFEIFFESFQKELQNKYNVIIFEACIDDIPTHTYNFKNNNLISVKFGF